jgi:3-methylcrotonyl-CoA carboxylase alpha subunit
MIAKLIVWDGPRPRPGAHAQALAEYRVVGVANNIEFLSRLTACPAFANADLDTGLIEREKDYLFPEQHSRPRSLAGRGAGRAAARTPARCSLAARHPEPASPWHQRDGWRMNAPAAAPDVPLRRSAGPCAWRPHGPASTSRWTR